MLGTRCVAILSVYYPVRASRSTCVSFALGEKHRLMMRQSAPHNRVIIFPISCPKNVHASFHVQESYRSTSAEIRLVLS